MNVIEIGPSAFTVKLVLVIMIVFGFFLSKEMEHSAIRLTRYIDASCVGLDAPHKKLCYDRQRKLVILRDALAWTPYEKTPNN
jgi:hypothetical protein